MTDFYRSYIRSPEWRRRRAAVLLRSGGRCERCGRWAVVNVHHLTYARLGSERPEDLLGVCLLCHSQLHQEKHL